MRVVEVMRSPAVAVAADEALGKVIETMNRSGYGFLPVTERGRVAGVVTGRDIAVRAGSSGVDISRLPVSALMTAPAVSVAADSAVEDALMLMRQRDLRRLVVTDVEGRPVGVIGLSDLAGKAPAESIAKNLERHSDNIQLRTDAAAGIPGLFLGLW